MKKIVCKHNKRFDFEHGFDLTDLGQKHWIELLKRFKLSAVNQKSGRMGYVWVFKDGYIVTGNDPLTGNYHRPESREPERGYLSYVGITGTKSFVSKVRRFIKSRAVYIKDESEDRSFI